LLSLRCIDLRADGIAAIEAFDAQGNVFALVQLDRAGTMPSGPARGSQR
jgi:hypothetical protein